MSGIFVSFDLWDYHDWPQPLQGLQEDVKWSEISNNITRRNKNRSDAKFWDKSYFGPCDGEQSELWERKFLLKADSCFEMVAHKNVRCWSGSSENDAPLTNVSSTDRISKGLHFKISKLTTIFASHRYRRARSQNFLKFSCNFSTQIHYRKLPISLDTQMGWDVFKAMISAKRSVSTVTNHILN